MFRLKSRISFQLAVGDSSQAGSLYHFDNPKSKVESLSPRHSSQAQKGQEHQLVGV